MPWWTLGRRTRSQEQVAESPPVALSAAATPVPGPRSSLLRRPDTWQQEAWRHYDSQGEYRFAVDWKSSMLSRVRLYAARLVPGQDEPERIEDEAHPAVRAMALVGGVAGQSGLIGSLSVQLDVPGEGYLIAENQAGAESWSVRSVDEVRAAHGHYEVVSDASAGGTLEWRPLAPGSLVTRVYRPHRRWSYLADSPARAARSTMDELDLVNRHIQAQYRSRLASAGVVLFPEEVTFPAKEEFADAPDPFVAEWVETAKKAIQEPGTASAVVPIPMMVPGEWLDKVKHLDFTLKIDEKIVEKRESAIKRLATQLNIPAEVLLGMGDINHWGMWGVEEGALKTTIAPDAELISHAVTTGYLQPRMLASGVDDADRIVVWYDMSELTIRPDRSANAFQAYDRLEISGDALRRETGFDDADAPDDAELETLALRSILRSSGQDAFAALGRLLGDKDAPEPTDRSGTPGPESTDSAVEQQPRTEPEQPTQPPSVAAARTQRLIAQAKAKHFVKTNGLGECVLLHPDVCEDHPYSCPYTFKAPSPLPGRAGVYACSLDAFGRISLAYEVLNQDVSAMIPTREFNGARR